jgi:hypothetical protein
MPMLNDSPAAGLPPTTTLTSQFQQQKASFLREGPPSLQARRDALRRLKGLVTGHEADIAAAVSTDFGHRSRHETLLGDLFTTVAGIKHASRHLARECSDKRRSTAAICCGRLTASGSVALSTCSSSRGGVDACGIVSGREPQRLAELLRDGRTRGTRLR